MRPLNRLLFWLGIGAIGLGLFLAALFLRFAN